MSRGDAIYFKGDVDMLDGEKIGQLSPMGVYTYLLGFWATAVKYRTDTFHATKDLHFSSKRLAFRLHIDYRIVARHAEKMYELGLLIKNPDGSVTVKGVRDCHPKLGWKEYIPDSRYGSFSDPHMIPIRVPKRVHSTRVREYESTNVPLGTSEILITPQDSSNSGIPESEESVVNDPVEENLPLTPEHERWSKTDGILASLWPHGMSPEFRESAKWKIYNAVSTFPELWINEALTLTRDKQLRIAEGTSPNFTAGPGSYFHGILNKRKDGNES